MPAQTADPRLSLVQQPIVRRRFQASLSQAALNVKDKTRSSLFAWRGQFSPQFVEAILGAYCNRDASVLDPFMGSGTVLVEGARRGHTACGIEANPAAYSIARLYEFCSMPHRVRTVAVDRVDAVLDRVLGSDLPLLNRTLPEPGMVLADAASTEKDPSARALLEALVVLTDDTNNEAQFPAIRQRWRDIRNTVLSLPHAEKPVRALLGDARQIALAPGSVDFVLTSPPYINVFNYHHNYRSSTEALGWQPLIVARSEIGANRKFRQNRFLTVVQYCIDMALALREMRRVGRDKFLAVLVLGRESNVHMTPFFNGDIVATVAVQVAGFSVVQKQERVFTNRFGQAICEDILHLQATLPEIDIADAVGRAREIGRATLTDATRRVPSDRQKYLDDAIQLSADIGPSPMLEPSSIRKIQLLP